MADKIWVGGTNDWSTGSNWSPVASAPATGDNVYFTGSSNTSVGAGLDQSAVALASLNVSKEYPGSIGSTGSPLVIDATTLRYYGSGAFAGFSGDYGSVFIDSSQVAANAIELTGQGSDITNLYVYRGRVLVKTTSTIVNVHSLYRNSRLDDVVINIEASCTITNFYAMGGSGTLQSAITLFEIDNGSFIHTTGAITTLNAWGGSLDWRSTTTMVTANLRGATLETRSLLSPRTITTLNLYPGSQAFINAGVTVTTENDLRPI